MVYLTIVISNYQKIDGKNFIFIFTYSMSKSLKKKNFKKFLILKS
jgi:hypothetical protein